jgi:hypothetical protein
MVMRLVIPSSWIPSMSWDVLGTSFAPVEFDFWVCLKMGYTPNEIAI